MAWHLIWVQEIASSILAVQTLPSSRHYIPPQVSLVCEYCRTKFSRAGCVYRFNVKSGVKHTFCSASCNGKYHKDAKGLRVWTDEDRASLKSLVDSGLGDVEIGVRMNRTAMAIESERARIGIRRFKHWTKKQHDFLFANSGRMTYPQMARYLGKSAPCIAKKMRTLGLRQHPKPV